MSGNGNTARQKKDAKMGNKEKRSAARDRIPGEKTRGSPPRKNLPPPLLVPPTRQEGGGGGRDVASLVQIYAVFSDDVMLRSCAVLRKTQGRHAFNSTS